MLSDIDFDSKAFIDDLTVVLSDINGVIKRPAQILTALKKLQLNLGELPFSVKLFLEYFISCYDSNICGLGIKAFGAASSGRRFKGAIA